jgi:hypothetical protein
MLRYIKSLMNKKFILVMFWAIILGVNTWTTNLGALLRLQFVSFKWVSSPYLLSFFNFNDITKFHSYVFLVKLGHFLGFAVLDLLIFNWKKSHKWSLVISFSFALLTEILQLFFGRDGRLYDLIIDCLGAISVYFILKSCLK